MSPPVLGVILAGGLARRMGGGDKALLPLGSGTLLDAVIARARPQVHALVLNANGDPARFARFGLEVVADPIAGFPGPLAGVLAGLEAAAQRDPPLPWVVSLAADTPFFPTDLVERLFAAVAREGAELACAASGAGRTRSSVCGRFVSRALSNTLFGRGPAQNRPLDGALPPCGGGLAERALRSLLQRQHARRARRSRTARGSLPTQLNGAERYLLFHSDANRHPAERGAGC